MMGYTISAQLSEAIHGILTVMLAYAAFNAARFVLWRWSIRAAECPFYTREIKAAVALTVTWSGLCVLTGAIWWMLHMRNHGGDRDFLSGPYLLIGGAVMATWGSVCWAHTTRPDKDGYAWLVITALGIHLGIYFARP